MSQPVLKWAFRIPRKGFFAISDTNETHNCFIYDEIHGYVLNSRNQTANFIYYSHYSEYSMTTIQVSSETKKLISTFGSKEETYEDIIKRMYTFATKEQLREFLLSSEDAISLAEARKRHHQKWQE